MLRALDDSRIDGQAHGRTCQGTNDWSIMRGLGDNYILYVVYLRLCNIVRHQAALVSIRMPGEGSLGMP